MAPLRHALACAACIFQLAIPVHAATHTVVIEAMQFSPQTLVVAHGDTVVWINKDAFPHDVTADGKAFKSKPIAPNTSWKFIVRKKGSFAYHCSLHPMMRARLSVN